MGISKNLSPIFDLVRADGSIIINKNLMFSIGTNEAIFYMELLSKYNYFYIREKLTEDGCFYNSIDNMQLDTGLGEKPQRAVIEKLKKFGLIEYYIKCIPAKRFFKIINDTELLLSFIAKGREKREELTKIQLQKLAVSKERQSGGSWNS